MHNALLSMYHVVYYVPCISRLSTNPLDIFTHGRVSTHPWTDPLQGWVHTSGHTQPRRLSTHHPWHTSLWTDSHLWKHYLPKTSFVIGNKGFFFLLNHLQTYHNCIMAKFKCESWQNNLLAVNSPQIRNYPSYQLHWSRGLHRAQEQQPMTFWPQIASDTWVTN